MAFYGKNEKKSNPLPDGVYQGVTTALIDLGTQYNDKYEKYEPKLLYMWELPELPIKFERDGREIEAPRVISKKYTNSLASKANLVKDLQSWLGRKLTNRELGLEKDKNNNPLPPFDYETMVGTNCMLQIINTEKDGKSYPNVSTILPLHKTMTPEKPFGEVRIFQITPGMQPSDVPAQIPQWIREMILKSSELTGGPDADDVGDVSFPAATHDDVPL